MIAMPISHPFGPKNTLKLETDLEVCVKEKLREAAD